MVDFARRSIKIALKRSFNELIFHKLDVDTPELDEKSVITYVSQLYDVFPDPPSGIYKQHL